ncbi:MAG TPA: DegT/DnrJ/EryC1/StrS family aminotransferase [Victivallales bacterium]|nr:DegT/DnrJ/EryC1/StrS family aminotransferase [Victivallales bacterium]
MIKFASPKDQYLSYKREIDAAIKRVLDSGWYILGCEVSKFEKEFSSYIGSKDGIGVGSGTEALYLALIACGIRPGDEVITVSHTATATAAAIRLCGAVPVFVDIEPIFYTINPKLIESEITKKTKAIIPVHIYGQAADMEPIIALGKKHGLKIIEDCAQAHGAMYKGQKVGSFGDLSCFSFYPTKNLGAVGDGGMILTDDSILADKIKLLREYGWKERYISSFNGTNSRLDEIQAAVLRIKLNHLDKDNSRRKTIAQAYTLALKNSTIAPPCVRKDCNHVYHLYVISTDKRNNLASYLKNNGINTGVHYPVPVHCQPAYAKFKRSDLIQTENISNNILSLPMYPELNNENIKHITETIKKFKI